MPNYFNINFEFKKTAVINEIENTISQKQKGYICVVEGNILAEANTNREYLKVINGAILNISDSSWIPVYIKWIYGKKYSSFTGNDLFTELLGKRKYTSLFLGSTPNVLDALKSQLKNVDAAIETMKFISLPFCTIDNFDYQGIANDINEINPDIIWISLGAPKQEFFMAKLTPYINRGILIAVGAVFNYQSGISERRRAPAWLIRLKLEWLFRVLQEPRKNFARLFGALKILPKLFKEESKKKKNEATHS